MGKAVEPSSHRWQDDQLIVRYDETDVEFVVSNPELDSKRRLYADVTGIVGGEVANTARIDFMDQRQRVDFHGIAAMRDGKVPWQAYLVPIVSLLRQWPAPGAEGNPEPLLPAVTAVEPFPVEVYPAPMRRLVEEGSEALPCPPDFIAVSMLSVGGMALGNSVEIVVKEGWRERARFYTGDIAETGSKKSPALNLAMAPIYEWQVARSEEFKVKKAQYEKELRAGNKPSGPAPRMPQLYTSDTTVEALAALMEHNPRGLIVVRDELSGWVLSMNQYKGGHGADRQAWLSYWSGVQSTVNRKGQDPIVIKAPFVCVTGGIQPDVLGDLADDRGRKDGFLERVLFSYADPIPAAYSEKVITKATVDGYRDLVLKLLLIGNDVATQALHMTPEAKHAFVALLHDIVDQRNDPDTPEFLRGVLAKMEGHAARFALLLHMCYVAAGETTSEHVGPESIEGAGKLVRYFISHARRVYPCLQRTPEDRKVDAALAWIKTHGNEATARDILRYKVAGVKTATEAQALLRSLGERGLGKVTEPRRGQVKCEL